MSSDRQFEQIADPVNLVVRYTASDGSRQHAILLEGAPLWIEYQAWLAAGNTLEPVEEMQVTFNAADHTFSQDVWQAAIGENS
jgi:hypothetical protein